jgi:3-hydroxyisobutyrate dehydrogenase-like beta-hydroxyacid dehydrogenase
MRVGLLGSGPRADSIAKRIAAAFGSAIVFDPAPRPQACSPLEGAVACRSVEELRLGTDVVVTLLPDEQALRTVLFGHAGLTQTIGKAVTVLDLSPIAPWTLEEIVARCRTAGMSAFGGSIVAGTKDGQTRSTLYIDHAALQITGLRAVLRGLADDVVSTGKTGSAKAVAMLTDVLVGVNSAVVREALALGHCAGLDAATLVSLLLKGSGATAVMALAPSDAPVGAAMVDTATEALRGGLQRAVEAARRVDHSVFFASLGIASLLAQPQPAASARAADARAARRA